MPTYLKNHRAELHQISCAYLLWLWLGLRFDTLYISSFVDDVMFLHKEPLGASCVFPNGEIIAYNNRNYDIGYNQILPNNKD